MNRRTYLGAAGAASLAGLAGCIGLLGLDEHTANPVGVSPEVRNDTGYQQTGIDDLVVEESVDLQLWSETVSVTNYVVEHEKSVSVGPLTDERAAVFAVLSTPQISVIGQQVNPVEDMQTGELVELLADNYDDIGDVSHVEDDELSILDQAITASTFTADARFTGGQSVDVTLHVTEAVETDDDLVVGVGVYPEALASEERRNVETLLTSIDPGVDVAGEGGDGDGGGDDGDDDGDDDDGGLGLGL
ncbi:DUF6517 family protein [Halovivax gelatinilyticus]|uniref:DUF6517 family protein n=1 Tax=Halovivax gelatinilyticus TaxID=2961597 RepID=UPI0020CA80E6|nr:DUF6517 family protein [Halovivax gelatinilyticus]